MRFEHVMFVCTQACCFRNHDSSHSDTVCFAKGNGLIFHLTTTHLFNSHKHTHTDPGVWSGSVTAFQHLSLALFPLLRQQYSIVSVRSSGEQVRERKRKLLKCKNERETLSNRWSWHITSTHKPPPVLYITTNCILNIYYESFIIQRQLYFPCTFMLFLVVFI